LVPLSKHFKKSISASKCHFVNFSESAGMTMPF
jgi:hypothetical protein